MRSPSIETMSNWLSDVIQVESAILVVQGAIAELKNAKESINYQVEYKKPAEPDGATVSGVIGTAVGRAGVTTIPVMLLSIVIMAVICYGVGRHTLLPWPLSVLFPQTPYDETVAVTDSHGLHFEKTGEIAYNVGNPLDAFSGLGTIGGFLIYALVVFLFLALIFTIFGMFFKPHRAAKYNKELNEIKERELNENNRLATMRASQYPVINKQLTNYNQTLKKLIDTRSKLYETGYLAEQYWGLAPAAAMYGYLISGRCTSIRGHGGIIDTYEHDRQFSILNSKLDVIITKLDEIQYTQSTLYQALTKTNNELNALRSDISRATQRVESNQRELLECERYNRRVLSYIASIDTYQMIRSY